MWRYKFQKRGGINRGKAPSKGCAYKLAPQRHLVLVDRRGLMSGLDKQPENLLPIGCMAGTNSASLFHPTSSTKSRQRNRVSYHYQGPTQYHIHIKFVYFTATLYRSFCFRPPPPQYITALPAPPQVPLTSQNTRDGRTWKRQ